jgi:NAD(P)-dependent dehydrogenase (short-subunit alcohol dehydrogenase family)
MTRRLEGKNAIIYGAGGGIGRGVARTFAREGARVFLAGRTQARLDAVAETIAGDGGQADVAVVNTMSEEEVAAHAREVADLAGTLDVSWNLTSRGDVQGIPLIDMTLADFMQPITAGTTTNFITARAAARIMVEQGSGVILAITSGSSAGTHPMMGGTGPADAATEVYLRYLAKEIGPRGVRVVGLWTAGVPETFGLADDTNATRRGSGMGPADIDGMLGPMTMLGHAPRLDQVADAAAFLASDRAGGITGTRINVTCGLVPG